MLYPMADEFSTEISEQVRLACAWVAGRARFVNVEESTIETYARSLRNLDTPAQPAPDAHFSQGDRETRAAFVLCLDAINFGSGWWPTIRKRSRMSGYLTIAAGLTERFLARGAWSAEELAGLSPTEIASVLGQDSDHPLMSQFATSLRDVGAHVRDEHDRSFTAVIEAADGSALLLADLLARWQAFADTSLYDECRVPFFKRAQITPADLNRAGVASLRDENRLTAFADNLVPHVLRLDGVLRLDRSLVRAIDTGELLIHGSPQEVELRACSIYAIELLSAASGGSLSPAAIDGILWSRGSQPRYKAVPRPRSRNTAY